MVYLCWWHLCVARHGHAWTLDSDHTDCATTEYAYPAHHADHKHWPIFGAGRKNL